MVKGRRMGEIDAGVMGIYVTIIDSNQIISRIVHRAERRDSEIPVTWPIWAQQKAPREQQLPRRL